MALLLSRQLPFFLSFGGSVQMASFRLLLENLKNCIFIRRLANSNYDPISWRPRVDHRSPIANSSRVELSQAHLEAWGSADSELSLLYVPGGGFCFGPNGDHREFTTAIGKQLKARLFLLNYRLAPEHPFPPALKDTEEASLRCRCRGGGFAR